MRLSLVVGLLCFIFLEITAQTDYRPGYIITNEMDTIRGLVDYRGEKRNMKVCNFKMTKEHPSKEYFAGDIFGYRYDEGKYYISKKIDSKELNETVFVEFLLKGISNLYYYSSTSYTAFFIESEDSELLELKREEIEFEKDGRVYHKIDNRYIGLLNYAFEDCPEIRKDIAKTGLNHKDLIQLTKRYHDYVCTDESCIIYEKNLPVLRIELRPQIGYSISTISFIESELDDVDFKPSYSPVIGLGMDFMLPRFNEKMSLLIQLSYSKEYFYGSNIKDSRLSYYENEYYHFKNINLTSSAAIKYTYPKGHIRPDFFIGIYGNTILNNETKFVVEVIGKGIVNREEYYPDVLKKFQAGLLIGGGVEYEIFNKFRSFCNVSFLHGASQYTIDKWTKFTTFNISTGLIF